MIEKCCICGRTINGYGNNAQPYANGSCCDKCNADYVIPERLKAFEAYIRAKKEKK